MALIPATIPVLYQEYGVPQYYNIANYEPINFSAMDSIKPTSTYETKTICVPIFVACYYYPNTNTYRFYWRKADGAVGEFSVSIQELYHGNWQMSALKYNFPDLWEIGDSSLLDKLRKILGKMVDSPTKVAANQFASGGEIKFISDEVVPLDDFQFFPQKITSDTELHRLASQMPSASVEVEYPCDCPGTDIWDNGSSFPSANPLMNVIMHLNDYHEEWTREKIADWIDELHDKGVINAEFESWDDGDEPKKVEPVEGAGIDGHSIQLYTEDEWKDVGWIKASDLTLKFESDLDTIKYQAYFYIDPASDAKVLKNINPT